jgi:hypothetical protein
MDEMKEARKANTTYWLRQWNGLTEENIENLIKVLEKGEEIHRNRGDN